jgi:hypothetical protein
MKKTLFMLVFAMTAGAIVAKAQLQKGNVLIGGDIANFQIGLTTGAKSTFNVLPKAAWFVKDNLALGGYAKLGYATAKGQGSDFNYGVGVLGRQYAGGNAVPAVKHTRLFVEANFGIEGVNHSVSSTNTTTNGIGLGIGPGLAYFITPNIGLEGLLKYDGVFGFGTAGNASTLDFNFGFQIYLPGRTVKSAATNSR